MVIFSCTKLVFFIMWFKTDLEFIEAQKTVYKSLKPCYCQAISETVYFTSNWLNHLLYNRRRPRNIKEKKYRSALISYIEEVIKDATAAVKKIDPAISPYPFWILKHQVKATWKSKKQIIKVILVKKGAGKTEFLSVMKKC